MPVTITSSLALGTDYDQVITLLSSLNMPVEDIDKNLAHFFVVKDDGRLAGVIGLEIFGVYGFLRSMATDPAQRNKGIATSLVNSLFEYAREKGLTTMYLLTQTAEKYFEKKGFETIARDQVPKEVQQSREFSHLCPSTAVAMKKQIV